MAKKPKKGKKKKTGPKPGMRMTPKRELFCQGVAAHPKKCQTDIYFEIFTCSRAAAAMASSRLMAYGIIKDRIAEIQEPAMKKLEVTVERVIRELAFIAFADMGEMYGKDGKILPIKDMPEAVRRSICSVGMGRDTLKSGGGKVKILNKTTALELLGKTNLLNMFTEKVVLNVTGTPATEKSIAAAAADIAKDIAKEL